MSDIWKKIGFVIGAIVLLLVLAYSTIVFIPKIIALFTNIEAPFSSDEVGNIEVSTDQNNLETGEIFLLTWKDADANPELEYYFKYSCEDNLNIQTRDTSGVKTLVCDSPIRLNSGEGVIPLLPSLEVENSFRDITLTVYASETNTETVTRSGETLVTVKNTNAVSFGNTESNNETITTQPESTNTNTQNTVATNNTPTYTNTGIANTYYTNPTYGYADLAIVSAYYSNNSILMTVRNLGNRTTPTWYFSYSVPGDGIKYSPVQPALVPGSGVLVAIAFSNVPSGTVAITLDPNNAVIESNNFNNTTFVNYPGSNNYHGGYYNDYYYDRDDRRGNDDADLDIIDTEVGRLSGGRFVEDDEIDEDDTMVIRFVVENIGDESTGSWRYEVEEPRDGNHTYRSGRQNSLRPGERRTIYVEFDDLDEGDYRLEIEVDSDDDVDEERESNNTATVRIEVRD